MPGMTIRGYARRRGVRHSAVERAIAEGRISTLPDGTIDPEIADEEWRQNTLVATGDGGKLTKARLMLTVRKVAILDLQYKRLNGELISKDEVQTATFNQFRQIRDRVMGIPDRVAAMVAAECDPAKCYEILTAEIRTALQQFAESAEKGVSNEAH